MEVGRALMTAGARRGPAAGVVIGDESSSFIIIRHLAEPRLPVPSPPVGAQPHPSPLPWRTWSALPGGAADLPADVNRTFDVGGPEAIEYADMLDQSPRRGRGPAVHDHRSRDHRGARGDSIRLVTPIDTKLARPGGQPAGADTVIHERDLDG
ncbi:hypothetical protein QJS66_12260 [Kocuria rhizophila]|nr:hypothetical protein QJS66_12260 [Kocuria rhizophila]